jgi:hypothetical protein
MAMAGCSGSAPAEICPKLRAKFENEAPAVLVGVPREILEKQTSGKVESRDNSGCVNENFEFLGKFFDRVRAGTAARRSRYQRVF